MKAEELRIGNNIYDSTYPKRDAKVFRINSGSEWPITYSYGKIFEHTPLHGESLLPIPLTEEWLLKFGFFGHNNAWVLSTPGSNPTIFHFSIWYDLTYNTAELIPDITYVHQLQNLYFALTGEELTLKQ